MSQHLYSIHVKDEVNTYDLIIRTSLSDNAQIIQACADHNLFKDMDDKDYAQVDKSTDRIEESFFVNHGILIHDIDQSIHTVMTTISNYNVYVQAVNTAKYHNYQYWVAQHPVISDQEFDDLYFAIQQYEAEHPEDTLPDSPTRAVGSEGGKHTIPHRIPMLSTQKVKTPDDVIKWMRSTTKAAERLAADMYQIPANREAKLFSVEWKYDGTSCSLVYQDGHLIEASTRGDTKAGLGRDILCHLRGTGLFPVPQRLCCPVTEDDVRRGPGLGMFIQGRIEVRGEVVITDKNFNEHLKDVYPDPRTAAASILNTDGPTEYDCYLTFKAWQLITDGHSLPSPTKLGKREKTNSQYWSQMLLADFGFHVDQPFHVDVERIAGIIEYMTNMREQHGFPTDGIIIKLDNKRLWDLLGRTEHHPKYLLAYKFSPKGAETTIRSIEITIGDTGKRTPVAYFDPVTINGKTYQKASLGSEAAMKQKGICEGSRVMVVIANDVIPHIDRVLAQ